VARIQKASNCACKIGAGICGQRWEAVAPFYSSALAFYFGHMQNASYCKIAVKWKKIKNLVEVKCPVRFPPPYCLHISGQRLHVWLQCKFCNRWIVDSVDCTFSFETWQASFCVENRLSYHPPGVIRLCNCSHLLWYLTGPDPNAIIVRWRKSI
jgi:hypothetical protein